VNSQASSSVTNANPGRWRWRTIKDILLRRLVEFGGISVIAAIALIFIFLLSVVYPLFESPGIEQVGAYSVPGAEQGDTIYLAIEEQAEVAMRVTEQGALVFFDVHSGLVIAQEQLNIEENNAITQIREVNPEVGLLAVSLRSGEVLFFQHDYRLEFTDTQRIIHPGISYPYGETPFVVSDGPILDFAVGENENSLALMIHAHSQEIIYKHFDKETSFLDESTTLEPSEGIVLNNMPTIIGLLVNNEQEWGYILDKEGDLLIYDVRNHLRPTFRESVRVTPRDSTPTLMTFLTGQISLLIGDSDGLLSQWFQIRSDGDLAFRLTKIRDNNIGQSPVALVVTEQARKGVIAATESGKIKFLHTTSGRDLFSLKASEETFSKLAVAPRNDLFIAENTAQQIIVWDINNHHPETSWSALWGKIWYEDYPEPDYIWQSSSASNDFEPKYSLMPLTFGTIKAAFYAMLFAMPLGICGAIFTAYFMAPSMRKVVKPTIEIMEALPTVILGFLAGLWLAPFVELNLPGIFGLLFLMPFGIALVAWVWWKLPSSIKSSIPDGWQAGILIVPIILVAWICLFLSPYLEAWMFDGNVRIWMSESLGIDFDQRNALIIGIAMGFAVIPTIFSIAEDAIFSVPKHLTSGSLALGATPWQTLVRVVIPSASPGIFSAVMIGFGRAVGETMIVLMATGNTPVMDFSVFQGMRTLSANVAVELPESAVGSTHYRILFLAALVLFIFTFFFNTVAEIVRQRLRKKYSSL
jgi:phosphate transport system permease protein